MQHNKPLKSKTALKPSKTLRAKKKPSKQKVPSITTLRKKADTLFAHYVRLRDAELIGNIQWMGHCISCDREYVVRWYDEDSGKWRWGKKDNIGHFVGRGVLFLRYSDENCNGQDVYCNKWLSGNNAAYSKALDFKYGDGTAQQLIDFADKNKSYKLKREDLEQVISASKEYLNWCYEQEKQL
jgi:hypothetical protein